MLTFTRKVLSAHRRYDFESLFIVGPQGMGKTTYALLVLYEVYRDWDKALNHLVFDAREALPKLKNALKSRHRALLSKRAWEKRIKLLVFDDAGVHLSKYLFHTSDGFKLAVAMNALYNLIRSVCSAVIFTSPDMDTLKELRKKSWWIGEPRAPSGRSKPYRLMVLYRKTITASGMVVVSKKAVDKYDLRLIPQDVRKEYEVRRQEALASVLDRLEELLASPHPPQGAIKLVEKIKRCI